VSFGAGTRFAPSGRVDITATIRKYRLNQNDKAVPPTNFKADLTSLSVMANLYLELSENGGVTPYIGGSLGAAQNKLGDLKFDDGAGFNGTVAGDTTLGFAWGAMFGFSFPLAKHFAFDIAYRYMDLGSVQTVRDQPLTAGGITANYGGASGHLRVHELAAGFRF
jgi:opacity protein-like surface antigen